MKVKATKKAIRQGFPCIIELGYGQGQEMLSSLQPMYYTSGTYGWNADIYAYNYHTAICVGYRPFGTVRPSNDQIKHYNDKAIEIWNDLSKTWEERRHLVETLCLGGLICEVTVSR